MFSHGKWGASATVYITASEKFNHSLTTHHQGDLQSSFHCYFYICQLYISKRTKLSVIQLVWSFSHKKPFSDAICRLKDVNCVCDGVNLSEMKLVEAKILHEMH